MFYQDEKKNLKMPKKNTLYPAQNFHDTFHATRFSIGTRYTEIPHKRFCGGEISVDRFDINRKADFKHIYFLIQILNIICIL